MGSYFIDKLYALMPLASIISYPICIWMILRYPAYRFWIGFCCYGLVHGAQLSWMATSYYHGYSIYFGYIILVLIFSLQFALFSILIKKERISSLIWIFRLSAIWTLVEWSRQWILCGYIWNPMGLALAEIPYYGQMASLFGVWGLSFLAMLLSLSIFYHRRFFLVMGALPLLYGMCHLKYHASQMIKAPSVKVALVQTGFEIEEKVPIERMRDRFIHPILQWNLVLQKLAPLEHQKLDLIVFPESAFTIPARIKALKPELVEILFKNAFPQLKYRPKEALSHLDLTAYLASIFGCDIILGGDDDVYNCAFFISKDGKIERYEKQILLPPEYLPHEKLRSFIARYGIVDFFEKGKEAKVFEQKWIPSICYEECFSSPAREGRKKGGKMIVNLTNDGWYHHSRLGYEHYRHAKLRSIENGIPHVRACNTGITAALDSVGREIGSLKSEIKPGVWNRDVLIAHVPLYNYQTLYDFLGNNWMLAFFLCAIRWKNSCSKK